MPLYRFIPQTDERNGIFEIEGTDFDDACDGLEYELQMHDEYTVRVQPHGVMGVDVFLKRKFYETFLVSEEVR